MTRDQVGRLTHELTDCAVIVAHPDDETLWAGGTILLHPETRWTVLSLCRKSDPDRAPKFEKVMERYGARGLMGDLNDGPEQTPLRTIDVEDVIIDLLPSDRYDLVLTHGLWGEYTSHRRHEEVAKAVMALREGGRLMAKEVWMFAYEDGAKKYLPRAIPDADIHFRLPQDIWEQKYEIIHSLYGFAEDSFEARTTPREEAFWLLGKGK